MRRCSGYGVYVSTQEPASNPVTLALGDMNLGIAGIENPTGTGYMMYSEESVHTRFAANATSTGNADHLINVKYINGAWNYDNNKKYYVFTPRPSDRLLAELSFANDGVTMLQGAATTINGIYAGYIASDLVITPDRWGGAVNNGEYGVAGTYVTIARASSRRAGARKSALQWRTAKAIPSAAISPEWLTPRDRIISVRARSANLR